MQRDFFKWHTKKLPSSLCDRRFVFLFKRCFGIYDEVVFFENVCRGCFGIYDEVVFFENELIEFESLKAILKVSHSFK